METICAMPTSLPRSLPEAPGGIHQASLDEEESPLTGPLLAAKRILYRSGILFGLAFIAAWIFREELTALIRWPLVKAFPDNGADTILLTIIDSFMMHIKVCFFASIGVIAPYWLWIIWKAIRSRQESESARFSPLLLIGMIGLFYAGVAFAYTIALPAAFEFLVGYSMSGEGLIFGSQANDVGDFLQVSMREHITFTMKLLLAFGIGFESPIIMLLLARIGIVSPKAYAEKRGIALVVLAIASAVLTPPDPWTMVILLVPLYILYEFGIILARVAVKEERTEPPEAEK